jgi:hypothetical protein
MGGDPGSLLRRELRHRLSIEYFREKRSPCLVQVFHALSVDELTAECDLHRWLSWIHFEHVAHEPYGELTDASLGYLHGGAGRVNQRTEWKVVESDDRYILRNTISCLFYRLDAALCDDVVGREKDCRQLCAIFQQSAHVGIGAIICCVHRVHVLFMICEAETFHGLIDTNLFVHEIGYLNRCPYETDFPVSIFYKILDDLVGGIHVLF